MSDQDSRCDSSRLVLKLDLRDIAAGAGAVVMLIGCFAIHWGLGLTATGAGLIGLAWRLAR